MSEVIVLSPDQFREILREELKAFEPTAQQGRWLNPDEVAQILGHHTPQDVIRACARGEMVHFRKGEKKRSKYLIWSEDVNLFSQNLRKQEMD